MGGGMLCPVSLDQFGSALANFSCRMFNPFSGWLFSSHLNDTPPTLGIMNSPFISGKLNQEVDHKCKLCIIEEENGWTSLKVRFPVKLMEVASLS